MKKLSVVLLFACLCVTPAFAMTPSEQSIIKLAQLQDIDKQVEIGIKATIQEQRYAFEEMLVQNDAISNEKKKRIDDIFEKYTTQIAHNVMTKDFKEQNLRAFIKSAQVNYTQAEVDAYNAFLSTKEGKNIIQKQDKVSGDYMELFYGAMNSVIEAALSPESNRLTAKMFEEVYAVLGE